MDLNFGVNFESLLKQNLVVVDVRYRHYGIEKENFKYIVIQIDTDRDSFYPNLLKMYSGQDFKDKDIFETWKKILSHKLQMSKTLDRDISIKVATIDYLDQ